MVIGRTVLPRASFYKDVLIRYYAFLIIPLLVYCISYVVLRCDMFSVPSCVEAISRLCLIALSLSVLCDRILRSLGKLVSTCSRVSGYSALYVNAGSEDVTTVTPCNVALPIP